MAKDKISTNEQYLKNLVEEQKPLERQLENLNTLSTRLGELIKKRLKDEVTIYYGGSKERGTLLRVKPDLIMGIYWPEESDKTLEEIHALVGKSLKKKWSKTTAKNIGWNVMYKEDFYFSVIPGKIINSKTQKAIFYWESAEELLETSLKLQDEYIKENDRGNIVRLLKLWKLRKNIPISDFILELMCINACKGINRNEIEKQASRMFNFIYDNIEKLNVYDPVNEENLVSNMMDNMSKEKTKKIALSALQADNWGKVFKK
jgi:hypothetical protein